MNPFFCPPERFRADFFILFHYIIVPPFCQYRRAGHGTGYAIRKKNLPKDGIFRFPDENAVQSLPAAERTHAKPLADFASASGFRYDNFSVTVFICSGVGVHSFLSSKVMSTILSE